MTTPAATHPSPADAMPALLPTYARAELAFERGEGSYLFSTTGECYLDFAAGIAVNALGHAHPHLVAALKAQAEKLWHTSNMFRIPEQERLGKRLVDATFADTVFFTNSGAEAVECSLKMARRYFWKKGEPQRWRVLTFEGAFHGRTLATIAAGGQAKHLEGFGPKADGFDQVPFGDHEALRAAITSETAAIMVEPVQGEGGIRPVPPQCMRGLRELCDETGILLIFDEVQTGVGRTGHLFAHEASGISPDIMAIAKGIGGGFPVGACLATARAASGMTAGSHGSTFGGNPLAMAVGNAVLDVVLAPGFLEHVRRVANVLKQTLHGVADTYPEVISQVRGEGLLMGLKCVVPNTELQAALRNEHMLVVGGGDNTVRLLPPLVITEAEIREAAEKLSRACAKLRDRPLAAKA